MSAPTRTARLLVSGWCAASVVLSLTTTPGSAAAVARTRVVSRCDQLQKVLRGYLGQRAGQVTVGVTNLASNRRVLYRPHYPQRTASIVKVEILMALLARHHAPLAASRAAQARRMIENSNNVDAEALWNAVGAKRGLASFGRRVGLAHTKPGAASGPGYDWGLTLTTPADQLRLLALMVTHNHILNDRDRRFVRRLMTNVEPDQRWGITAGTSSQATVALKNGWLPLVNWSTDWQVNSIGYVHAPTRRYVLAVMTIGSPTMEYGIRTVERVSEIVWRYTRWPQTQGCP
jgi:beta-lactamase class A